MGGASISPVFIGPDTEGGDEEDEGGRRKTHKSGFKHGQNVYDANGWRLKGTKVSTSFHNKTSQQKVFHVGQNKDGVLKDNVKVSLLTPASNFVRPAAYLK